MAIKSAETAVLVRYVLSTSTTLTLMFYTQILHMQMKRILLLLAILTFCPGCLERNKQLSAGRFRFPKTHLSLFVPTGWEKTKIPGHRLPILSTAIDYGIKPNIQLERFGSRLPLKETLSSYIQEKKRVYPLYTIEKQQKFLKTSDLTIEKIKARRINADKIPVIHFVYVLNSQEETYVLSATCAEPSLEKYERVFDYMIKSVNLDHRQQ